MFGGRRGEDGGSLGSDADPFYALYMLIFWRGNSLGYVYFFLVFRFGHTCLKLLHSTVDLYKFAGLKCSGKKNK